jgi:aspartyl-tRNA(Asn)/glutamyl-tRNA(Gln) amidotransferase subunit A
VSQVAFDVSSAGIDEAVALSKKEGYESLRELLQARVDAVDPKVGAYINTAPLTPTPEPDKALPLSGLPVSLKDNMCVHDWETTCSSEILLGFIPPYSATVVEKLKAKGAVIFKKCDMDEFAFGSSCENSAFNKKKDSLKKKIKAGACVNPWDLERVPGGSSGGSAACVAAGEAICSLGSDTGGSIRQPAALCGIVGLKPTYGRVSRYGLIAFGSSLDQIGPLTKTVKDSAILLEAIAGFDPKDSTSVDTPVPNYVSELEGGVKGLRIGVPEEYFIEGLNEEVKAKVMAAIEHYKSLGAEIKPIKLPHTKYAVAVYYLVATAEASSNLARFDGVQYGIREHAENIYEMYQKTRQKGFGDEVKRRIILGTFALSSGYYDAYYLKAQKVRTLFKQDYEKAFKEVDVIISPTSPTTAFKVGEKQEDPLSMYLSDIYTISANLTGLPAISIPCGFDSKGLPIGLQLTAPAFEEGVMLRAAHTYEQSTDHHTKKPAL